MTGPPTGFSHLTAENRRLLELALERDRLMAIDPERAKRTEKYCVAY